MTVRGGGTATPTLRGERRLDRSDRPCITGLLPASRRGSRRATEKDREGHDDAKDLSHDEPPAPAGCVARGFAQDVTQRQDREHVPAMKHRSDLCDRGDALVASRKALLQMVREGYQAPRLGSPRSIWEISIL